MLSKCKTNIVFKTLENLKKHKKEGERKKKGRKEDSTMRQGKIKLPGNIASEQSERAQFFKVPPTALKDPPTAKNPRLNPAERLYNK